VSCAFRAILFVKPPVPGRVKTRLAASVGPEAALAAHTAMLLDAAAALRAAKVPAIVQYAPEEPGGLEEPGGPDRGEGALRALLGGDFAYAPQKGGDLGERMANALAQTFATGFDAAILAGGDAPGFSRDIIESARRALCRDGAGAAPGPNAVLGPAEDGGYYLIGFTARAFTPEAFAGIAWSGPDVFADTLNILRAAGIEPALAPRLRDVDELSDLLALVPERERLARVSPRIAEILERLAGRRPV